MTQPYMVAPRSKVYHLVNHLVSSGWGIMYMCGIGGSKDDTPHKSKPPLKRLCKNCEKSNVYRTEA
jgi:hypothetical protein